MTVNYTGMASQSALVARATVRRHGKRLASVNVEIRDDAGALLEQAQDMVVEVVDALARVVQRHVRGRIHSATARGSQARSARRIRLALPGGPV